jgi:hypothetical protein
MRRCRCHVHVRRVFLGLVTFAAVSAFAGRAEAISPDNPYRTFNLSGVNYGSMRWEQQHKKGRSSWPSTTNRSRQTMSGSSGLSVLSGGSAISSGGVVSGTRVATPQRRFRRRR